jgi:ABC-type transport system involved in multi-copper enzyme maturation permease subunit
MPTDRRAAPSALTRVTLVAWHVFKESVRDRVLYGIGAFAVLLVCVSVLVGELSAGEDVKIIKDLGLSIIEGAGILMTVFIGVGLVSREIDRRSIFGLLAKPLPRWEFVVGKYGGLILTIVVNVAAMTIALYLVLAYLDWHATTRERAAWDAAATDPRLLLAVAMIAAELALLTAVALFFSSFSSSALLSILFTVGIYLTGVFSADLRGFGDMVDVPPVVGSFVAALGWIVPAFGAFDIKSDVVHGIRQAPGLIAMTLGYGAMYVAGLLAATITVFARREFR